MVTQKIQRPITYHSPTISSTVYQMGGSILAYANRRNKHICYTPSAVKPTPKILQFSTR